MNAFGWVLLAVGGWILLSALAVGSWVWLGRWHNRRQFLRHAATLRDPVDAHFALAAALLQPDLDTPLADQVEKWLSGRTPHIRPATPDKEH